MSKLWLLAIVCRIDKDKLFVKWSIFSDEDKPFIETRQILCQFVGNKTILFCSLDTEQTVQFLFTKNDSIKSVLVSSVQWNLRCKSFADNRFCSNQSKTIHILVIT